VEFLSKVASNYSLIKTSVSVNSAVSLIPHHKDSALTIELQVMTESVQALEAVEGSVLRCLKEMPCENMVKIFVRESLFSR